MQPKLTSAYSAIFQLNVKWKRIDTNEWCTSSVSLTKRHNLTKTIYCRYVHVICVWNKWFSLRWFGAGVDALFTLAFNKFKDEGKHFHNFRIYRYQMGMIVLFMVFTRTSIFVAWSRSYAVPFTVRPSKRGRWVSAWSTRHLDTTTTRYRTWLPVSPFGPLTVNYTFNSTCISVSRIDRSWFRHSNEAICQVIDCQSLRLFLFMRINWLMCISINKWKFRQIDFVENLKRRNRDGPSI